MYRKKCSTRNTLPNRQKHGVVNIGQCPFTLTFELYEGFGVSQNYSQQRLWSYAYQTKLVWCIVGPVQNVWHQNLLKCNRVAVKDTSTDKLGRHRFLLKIQIKI